MIQTHKPHEKSRLRALVAATRMLPLLTPAVFLGCAASPKIVGTGNQLDVNNQMLGELVAEVSAFKISRGDTINDPIVLYLQIIFQAVTLIVVVVVGPLIRKWVRDDQDNARRCYHGQKANPERNR